MRRRWFLKGSILGALSVLAPWRSDALMWTFIVSPNPATAAESKTASGTGWTPGQHLRVTSGTTLFDLRVNADGAGAFSVVLPIWSAGSYAVRLEAQTQGWGVVAGVTLVVTATAASVPGIPQSLRAVPGNASVSLDWVAPASNGGSSISSYRVYRGGTTPYIASVPGPVFVDTGLTNDTAYSYTVSAVNSAGEGAQTGSQSATPKADLTLPIISNIVVTASTVGWSVSEPATGQVRYGPTTAYGNVTQLETGYLLAHVQPVVLSPGWHFRCESSDAAGNQGVSPDQVVAQATAAVYGPIFAADDLNNTKVGTSSDIKSAYRFRAEQSSALNSARIYIIANGNTGYSNGTGGTIKLDVFAVDGSGFPTGSSLANGSLTPGNPNATSFFTITFGSPATLVAGTLYAIVFSNTDGSPATNYCSVDNTFCSTAASPFQKRWPNTDWCELIKAGAGAWSASRGDGSANTPILQLAYANGQYQGNGYMETWGRGGSDGWNTCNGTIRLRERFTPTVGVSFRYCSVRLARSVGSSPLTVRIETAAGAVVASGTIPAASVVLHAKDSHGFGQNWATVDFGSTYSLMSGTTYNIQLSTASGTEYWTTCPRRGQSYGYQAATYFADGYAQIDFGGGWAAIKALTGVPTAEADLQVALIAP